MEEIDRLIQAGPVMTRILVAVLRRLVPSACSHAMVECLDVRSEGIIVRGGSSIEPTQEEYLG
jgi:hypothetical protein